MKRDIPELKGYLSLTQASEILKMSRQGVSDMIKKGQIQPAYQVGGYYIIPVDSLDRDNIAANINKEKAKNDRSRKSAKDVRDKKAGTTGRKRKG